MSKSETEIVCGACLKPIPTNHVAFHRMEQNGTLTSYHISCESLAKNIVPCRTCNLHRSHCSTCKDWVFPEDND